MSCPHGNPIGGCDTCDEVDAAFEAGKRSALAAAWQQGYDQGVADERTSEANIGIAGFDAKVNPARNNPYSAEQPAIKQDLIPEQPAQPAQQLPVAWRELCRRLYVELFHCDQQMMATLDEDGEPVWTQGKTVRDVLADAKAALDTSPPAQRKPLTDDEIIEIAEGYGDIVWQASSAIDFARAIEAALGITKGTK